MGQLYTGAGASAVFSYINSERTAAVQMSLGSSATTASSGTILTPSVPIYVTSMEWAPSDVGGQGTTVTLLANSIAVAAMRCYNVNVSSTSASRSWGHRREFSLPILVPAGQALVIQAASFNGNNWAVSTSALASINYVNASDLRKA